MVRDGTPLRFHPPSLGTGGADWAGVSGPSLCPALVGAARQRTGAREGRDPGRSALCKNRRMELTWYGRTCIRLRGKDAVVVNDPYPAIVGPTGRGITGDVVTYQPP